MMIVSISTMRKMASSDEPAVFIFSDWVALLWARCRAPSRGDVGEHRRPRRTATRWKWVTFNALFLTLYCHLPSLGDTYRARRSVGRRVGARPAPGSVDCHRQLFVGILAQLQSSLRLWCAKLGSPVEPHILQLLNCAPNFHPNRRIRRRHRVACRAWTGSLLRRSCAAHPLAHLGRELDPFTLVQSLPRRLADNTFCLAHTRAGRNLPCVGPFSSDSLRRRRLVRATDCLWIVLRRPCCSARVRRTGWAHCRPTTYWSWRRLPSV